MRMYHLLSFAIFSIVLLFTSCRPEPPAPPEDALLHIPADMNALAILRPQQMMDKADFEDVVKMEFYREAISSMMNDNKVLADVLANPERSGVDLEKNIYAAITLFWLEDEDSSVVATFLSLRDAEAFETFIRSTDLEIKPTTGSDYRYSTAGDHHMVAWNDGLAVLARGNSTALVQREMERYFSLTPDASLAENANLRQCLAEPFDMAFWLSSGLLADQISMEAITDIGIVDREVLRDNYIHNYVFFEKGEIRDRSRFFIKKELSNDLDLFFREGVRRDFSQLLPADNLEFMMTVAFEAKGINQILIEKYSKGLAEQQTQERYGFTVDDLLHAFDGDLAIGMYSQPDTSDQYLVVVASIEDQERLNTILEGIQNKGILAPLGDGLYDLQSIEEEVEEDSVTTTRRMEFKGQLWVNDDLLYLTSHDEMMTTLRAGNFSADGELNRQLRTLMQQNIFAAVGNPNADRDKEPIKGVRMWTDREEGQIILEMKNSDVNSLKFMLERMNEEFLKKKERKS